MVGCPMFYTQTPESGVHSVILHEVALYANGRIGLMLNSRATLIVPFPEFRHRSSDFGVSMCVMIGSGSNMGVKNKLFFTESLRAFKLFPIFGKEEQRKQLNICAVHDFFNHQPNV